MKIIVTTTINAPTEAIQKFDAMPDWHLIVIGDKKTPADFKLARGTYVPPEEQEVFDKRLSDAIGWNCIQRRNFGYLIALEMGAEVIASVDDDNIPYDSWGNGLMLGREVGSLYYTTDAPAFDPVGAAREHKHLWHRGFPLELLSSRDYSRVQWQTGIAQIQADFWNGDPDVDAFCRLEHAPQSNFDLRDFPIRSNKPSPFNSQNTFFLREVMQDYFLFPGIGRMDDIWASYYAQAKGWRPIYGAPSVCQKRNPHNLIDDLKKEYLGYEWNLLLIKNLALNPDRINWFLPAESVEAFSLYRRHFSK